MALATISGRIDEQLKRRLDEIASDRAGGKAEVVAEAVTLYLEGSHPIVEKSQPEPHPLQAELDAIAPKIEGLKQAVAKYEEAIVGIDLKIQAIDVEQQLPEGTAINLSGGIFDQLDQHIASKTASDEGRKLHAELGQQRQAAFELIHRHGQEIKSLEAEQKRLADRITADHALVEGDRLAKLYEEQAKALNAIGVKLRAHQARYGALITDQYSTESWQRSSRYHLDVKHIGVSLSETINDCVSRVYTVLEYPKDQPR